MEKNSRKKKKLLLLALTAVFLLVFIFSAVMLLRSLLEYRKENRDRGRLEDEFLVFESSENREPEIPFATTALGLPELLPETAPAETSGENVGAETDLPQTSEPAATEQSAAAEETDTAAVTEPKPLWPDFTVNWEALRARNSDVVGWIWMYDSEVSYPVLLGRDNSQYLYSDLDGNYARFGSIFMDYRCSSDFSDVNTVVYGHNGGYGVKFGGLMNFRLYSHWQTHPYICMLTPDGMAVYQIYSAYITNELGNPYITEFTSVKDIENFIYKTLEDSEISTGISPTADDRILTLSTCTNRDDGERMVVHGVRVN